MSSILKALKKLEEEQAARSTAPPLCSRGQYVAADSKRRRPVLLVGCIVVAILLVGVLFQAMRDIRELPLPLQPTQPPAVVIAPSSPAPGQTATPALSSTTVSPATVAVTRAPPVVATLQSGQPTLVKPERASAGGPAAEKPLPVDNRPIAAAPAEPIHQVAVERREIPLPGQQWRAPQLKVDEIIPAAGGEPMAIVNGLPVMEGTLVDNALVEKIHPDRVLFVIDGKVIEVRLSSSP
jgi:general secretion pathway protein B